MKPAPVLAATPDAPVTLETLRQTLDAVGAQSATLFANGVAQVIVDHGCRSFVRLQDLERWVQAHHPPR